MAAHSERTTWTDERLDDLSQSVRDGFMRNEADHRSMRQEMRGGFEQSERRFDQLATRIDSLQLTLIVGMIGLIGLIGAIIASSIFG